MKRFKTTILATIVLLMSLSLSFAQDKEERKVSGFNYVKVGQAINVYLKQGNEEKVRVEVDGIDLEDVMTEVSSGKLKIYLSRGNHRNAHVKVYVSFKTLEGVSASSAADVYSESVIKAVSLFLSASSAGSIDISVESNELEVSASSSGDVEISGTAKSIDATASSAGDIDAFDLKCEKADANASSAGSIKINVTESIRARASSGGSVKYKGNPSNSNTDSSSGGSVRKY